MPELPEVQSVMDRLLPAVSNLMITEISLRDSTCFTGLIRGAGQIYRSPKDVYPKLIGGVITTIIRKGKYLIFPLDNGNSMVIHLGMSGKIFLQDIDEDSMGFPPLEQEHIHSHFVLDLCNYDPDDPRPHQRFIFNDVRRFGHIWIMEKVTDITKLDIPGLQGLGPDALTVKHFEFETQIKNCDKQIKAFLLDQTKIAGVGNIYADEACFIAKINPARTTKSLSDFEICKLCLAVKTVLKEGIQYGGSSVSDYFLPDGSKGSYQNKHRVYGKTGAKCVDCEDKIERIKVAGRSTHFCQTCQPLIVKVS